MQFQAFEPGIEVNGQTVYAVVDGVQVVQSLAFRHLRDCGIGEPRPDGSVWIDPAGWYSQTAWLETFRRIAYEVGPATLFQIGQAIPKNAKFPPWVTDIDSAIRSIDIAYHMNHRKGGEELFDPERGTMREGIGHYGYAPIPGQRRIRSVCTNPYPCSFDHGIITAMARRFSPAATVTHDDAQECRQSGAESCTYVVSY
ncbi:MAG: hypothetical protein OEY14_03135 [Myxococcales bacterium]|nr:hypothetical protein [Myxococcales bacterium]